MNDDETLTEMMFKCINGEWNMKKPSYANLNRQFLERNKQANQYHDNWIKEIAEVNKLKLKLSEAHKELTKAFVQNEALKSSLKSLLECL